MPTRRRNATVSSYLLVVADAGGNFVQSRPRQQTKGDFYIQKPGKLRFEYEAPSPIAVIADGCRWRCATKNSRPRTSIRCRRPPLRFLLSDRIDLLKDTNVVKHHRRRCLHQHHHRGKAGDGRHQRMMLMIAPRTASSSNGR